jgi:UDP-N-acetyl-D-mannosaminuronate dehydrogenase
VKHEYGVDLLPASLKIQDLMKEYNAVVLAVAHEKFREIRPGNLSEKTIIYDIKAFWPRESISARL